MEGVVCRGPDKGAKETYVLLKDSVEPGREMPREKALAELARRYLNAYAPARPEDFATWSGLPMSEARAGWKLVADELMEVEVEGRPAWILKSHMERLDERLTFDVPDVRLLARFDTYLLGYGNRDFAVAQQHAKRVITGGGIVHATVIVNGRIVGLWSSRRQRGGLEVMVEPFEEFDAEVRTGLEVEVADLARFLGAEVGLDVMGV